MVAATKKEDSEPTFETKVPASFTHEKFKWFAVLTQSGMEKKAKASLEERIKKLKMTDFFGYILIPTLTVERLDMNGKKKKVEQRMMPGYLFIQLDPENKSAFGCVKDTPKITRFMVTQPSQDPRVVPDEELSRIFNRVTESSKAVPARSPAMFEKGDKVKVIDGPFTNFVGDVDEVKADKMKLRLLISVFGRATPVELEFNKVEKVKEE